MPTADGVLLLGWEYPPEMSGGLGVVTDQLLRALLLQGVPMTLLLPDYIARRVVLAPENALLPLLDGDTPPLETLRVSTTLFSPYLTPAEYRHRLRRTGSLPRNVYGENLYAEIDRYTAEALTKLAHRQFCLVHAQDWITGTVALEIKQRYGTPYLMHVHLTSYDMHPGHFSRSGEVYEREYRSMHGADRLLAVSQYTRQVLMDHYDVPAEKITVVHNAYNDRSPEGELDYEKVWPKDQGQFWVLFIGRFTYHKGIATLLDTAQRCIAANPQMHFFLAGGQGELEDHVRYSVSTPPLRDNVHYLGFINRPVRDALYTRADAMLIPSVSEPFGLIALEAVMHHTPLVVSSTCGATELITHKLSADWWDSALFAEHLLNLAAYPALRRTLREKALQSLPTLSWDTQASLVRQLYSPYLS
ncbi:glycosyltransferase family 4 protein [Candidatus Peribacteria bacterium]|nr:glycosyltransferase family 4 protein [Candidatus Peribacteria bacterium]